MIDSLTKAVQETGEEEGLIFLSHSDIRIQADEDVPPTNSPVGKDQPRTPGSNDGSGDRTRRKRAIHPCDAFHCQWYRGISTTQSVINIGRRTDNQLVIDDPRISRGTHSFGRLKGRYVIFDLDSTGGTFVNDQRDSGHPYSRGMSSHSPAFRSCLVRKQLPLAKPKNSMHSPVMANNSREKVR